MRIRNSAIVPAYWDEGKKVRHRWYQKGKMKRVNRKRWTKKILKNNEE